MRTRPRSTVTLIALSVAALIPLGACAPTSSSESVDSLQMIDPWVKTAAAGGMTAAFGSLENTTDSDMTITGATTDAAGTVELHEVVDGVMQERDGGFVIPAGDTLVLEPGGLHLMLMSLPADIDAGEDIDFTLALADGSTVEVTAPAKDFDGADEDYDGGMDMDMDMDMDHSMDPADG